MSGRTMPGRIVVLFGVVVLLSVPLVMMSPVAAESADQAADAVCEEVAPQSLPETGCEAPREPAPEPSEEPVPDPSEEPDPQPTEEPVPQPTEPAPDPAPDPAPEPAPDPSGGGGKKAPKKPAAPGSREAPGEGTSSGGPALLEATTEPAGEARSGGAPFVYLGGQGSTEQLIEILAPLEDHGIPLEEALLRVAGPFPVAGLSWWTNDWHAARCCPTPHLHKGLDMFAEEGTPLVAIADGRVSQKIVGAVSGLSVEITDEDGVEYFYAHLSAFAEDLLPGQEVERGDVIGFVGDTGNARGTMPHLHLEVQPGGVSEPPIPYVEEWLERAERKATRLVERITGQGPVVTTRTASIPVSMSHQLLEHPAIPTGGAVPTSLETLDRPTTSGVEGGTSEARPPVAAEGSAAREVLRSTPILESAGMRGLLVALLLGAGVLFLAGRRAARTRSRRALRRAEGVPRVRVELPVPVRAATAEPEAAGSEPKSGAGLIGAGTTLLVMIGALVLLLRRTRRSL